MLISRVITWADKVMAFSFYALIFFLPVSIAFVEIFASLALLSYFVKRGFIFYSRLKELKETERMSFLKTGYLFLQSFKPVDSILNRPIGIFIFVGFLTIFISQYPILSIKGFFFKLLEWTFIYFNFVECMTTPKRLKIFMSVFLISATVIMLNGIVQKVFGIDLIRHNPLMGGRISSTFRHPNNFGGYLVVIAPMILSFLFFYRSDKQMKNKSQFLWKAVTFTLFALALICLGLTMSRGAWVAFFAALILMSFFRPKFFYIPVLITLIFMTFFAPQMKAYRDVSLFSDSVASEKYAVHPSNWYDLIKEKFSHFAGSGRKSFWAEAIHIIRKFPILGIGLNTYSQVAPEFKITWGGYPHNCYLQLTAEMGFVGLASFLWIFVILFRHALRHLKGVRNDFLSCLFLGSLMSLVGYLVHIALDTDFYEVQLGNLLWIVMGIIVAVYKIQSTSTSLKNTA